MAQKKDMSWLENEEQESIYKAVDCNGSSLKNGDSIIATKDLKVKGASDIKRGDVFKNIRLTEDSELVESGSMVLRREFFKKK